MSRSRDAWAFVVGINTYPQGADQRPLNGAVADAADFAHWALHPDGGAVPANQLFFWTYPEPDPLPNDVLTYLANPTPWWDPNGPRVPDFQSPPTRRHITETALSQGKAAREAARVAMMEGKTPRVRRCYVFLAGHGVQSHVIGAQADQQICYVCEDFRADAQGADGLLPCDEFRRALLAGGFDEVIMFLDCCRTGAPKVNDGVPSIGAPMTLQPVKPIFIIGAAAQMGDLAYETQSAPIRGAFSQTLVQGLRGVRSEGPPELSLESLRLFVKDNIKAAAHPQDQRPDIDGKPNDPYPVVAEGPVIPPPQMVARGGGAVAASPPPVADIHITFRKAKPGQQVQLVDGDGVAIGPPMDPANGPAVRTGVTIKKLYGLDLIGSTKSHAFRHPGPGDTRVTF